MKSIKLLLILLLATIAMSFTSAETKVLVPVETKTPVPFTNGFYFTVAERNAAAAAWKKRQPYGTNYDVVYYEAFVYPGGWIYWFEATIC